MVFKDSVRLANPQYTVECDTLRYHTPTVTAHFLGPTVIESTGEDSTFIYCETGWYDTGSGRSWFGPRSFIQSRTQRLTGDSLLYDKLADEGRAYFNVTVHDVDNDLVVRSDFAEYFGRERRSLATGRALFSQAYESDSLHMHADTLLAVWDSLENRKTYYAFHRVRLFKSDLQGKCDSLVYAAADSNIALHGSPVLWSEENQMTADSIHLRTAGKGVDRMYLYNTAFVAAEVDSVRFNQVKGKHMTGRFEEGKLRAIDVDGNGQTVYYVSEKEGETERLTGVNRAECSNLTVYVKEGKVDHIHLYTAPAGTLYPIGDLKPEELRLKGFSWLAALRPVDREDIFNWR
jgi:hypothetical protein